VQNEKKGSERVAGAASRRARLDRSAFAEALRTGPRQALAGIGVEVLPRSADC